MLGIKIIYISLCTASHKVKFLKCLENFLTHCTSCSAFLIQVVKISQTEKPDCLDTELNCCCCVSCRLRVICLWELYIIYNRNITDICSLEINIHSCEVEQAWLIDICQFYSRFDCFCLSIILLSFSCSSVLIHLLPLALCVCVRVCVCLRACVCVCALMVLFAGVYPCMCKVIIMSWLLCIWFGLHISVFLFGV